MIDIVEERDSAFIYFVKTGSVKKVDAYCKKYGVQIPANPIVKKVGIYKAVMQCANIPEDIKNIAMVKCLELGFSPFMNWSEEDEETEE